ncbi:MAG: hypothetical protein IJG16_01145 [Clostridia bacterium]|nr:hypothetical protein [Clostridia bacterium]
MTNDEIRADMRANKIYNWQLAHTLGVCEQTIIRWFRLPLTDTQRAKILNALTAIKDKRK